MQFKYIQKFNEKLERKFTLIEPKTSKKSKFSDLSESRNAIFLAGPCPRKPDDEDWRDEALNILDVLCFDGVVISPTNRFYDEDNSSELELQTKWEYEAMKRASAIVFWMDKSKEHPGFTSNIEIGNWMGKSGIFVGIPEDNKFGANNYIRHRLNMCKTIVYSTLNDTLAAAVQDLKIGSRTFFTSDTHFGQERTRNLTRRPFDTIFEMDMELISNWNKTVRCQDAMYHLGDFGCSVEYLKGLNYGEFNLVKGNYEHDVFKDLAKEIENMPNCNVYENDEKEIKVSEELTYTLRHQPIDPYSKGYKNDKTKFYLFGHIHGKELYKKNGIDVGTDAYFFTPVSLEEINWRHNAVLNYCDDNVFTDRCK